MGECTNLCKWRLALILVCGFGLQGCGVNGCGNTFFSAPALSYSTADCGNPNPSPSPTPSIWNQIGSGTSSDPYQLFTAAQFQSLAADSAAQTDASLYFALENDIDFAGQALQIPNFAGTLNGQNYAIQNVTASSSSGSAAYGVIGALTGTVSNLNFTNLNVSASTHLDVGAIGTNSATGTVSHVNVTGGSISGNSYVGGVVGANSGVVSQSSVDGITVSAGSGTVAGLVGENYSGGTIQNCYIGSSTVVSNSGGSNFTGGIVARNYGTLSNCYALGTVSGGSYVGGIMGSDGGTTSNVFSGATVAGTGSFTDYVVGSPGGTETNLSYVSGTSCTGSPCSGGTNNSASYYYSSTNLSTFSTTYWNFSGTTYPTLY